MASNRRDPNGRPWTRIARRGGQERALASLLTEIDPSLLTEIHPGEDPRSGSRIRIIEEAAQPCVKERWAARRGAAETGPSRESPRRGPAGPRRRPHVLPIKGCRSEERRVVVVIGGLAQKLVVSLLLVGTTMDDGIAIRIPKRTLDLLEQIHQCLGLASGHHGQGDQGDAVRGQPFHDGVTEGARSEGPSMVMVWQRWRRRSRSASTIFLLPRNSYQAS